jgi:hypothetical protein
MAGRAMDGSLRERISIGDRVQLSSEGRRNARILGRSGIVLAVNRTGTQFRVQWDGSRRGYFLHHTYVERAELEE